MGNVSFGSCDFMYFWVQEKLRSESTCIAVPQTDTGELVEYTKVDERTFLKELGKLARRNLGRCLICTLVLVLTYGSQIKNPK